MADEDKNLSNSVNLNKDVLENTLGKIRDNVVELTSYDANIEAFQISPNAEFADGLLKNSEYLFKSDILKLDADILNPSLKLNAFNSDLFNPQSISNVNEGITSLINEPLKLSDSINEILAVDSTWSKKYDPLKIDINLADINGSVRLPRLDISTNNLATNALLSESTYLDLDLIGKNIVSNFSFDAHEALADFSISFSKFGSLIALDNEVSTGFRLNDDILTLSSKQLLRSSSLLDDLALNEGFPIPHYTEKNAYLKQQEIKEEEELKKWLHELDDGLVDMLDGAERALLSSNPDKTRHFGTSLRELFTHVLHQLAPNDEVAKWSNDPEHYYDQKPTRRARILYISRNLHDKKFQEFLDADVKAVVSFIKLFQGITHSVKSSFTEQQLKGMLIKMKGTLFFFN